MEEDPRLLTPNQIVAYNLRRAREIRGWTQEVAAERLEPFMGIRWSTATFSAAERSMHGGRIRHFNANEIVAMAEAFDLPVGWFYIPPPDHPDYRKMLDTVFGRLGDIFGRLWDELGVEAGSKLTEDQDYLVRLLALNAALVPDDTKADFTELIEALGTIRSYEGIFRFASSKPVDQLTKEVADLREREVEAVFEVFSEPIADIEEGDER